MDAVAFFNCVFPGGLDEAEYFPLLYILAQDMSFGAAARAIGEWLRREDEAVYRDIVYAGMPGYKPDWDTVIALRSRLADCGYEAWLEG